MAQVGMPTSEPKGALDLNTTTNTNTYGLVLPTTDNPKQKIRNPNENNNLTRVEGTMIYDSRQDCVRIFQKGSWSNCLCTKGDEGCLDYFPGQGGGLNILVINEHTLGYSAAPADYTGTNNSHYFLELPANFSTTGIYNKFENLLVGRVLPPGDYQKDWGIHGTTHNDNFRNIHQFSNAPTPILKNYRVASVSFAALGFGTSNPADPKGDAIVKFAREDKKILFLTLGGDANAANPGIIKSYGFRDGLLTKILMNNDHPILAYDGNNDKDDYSNNPYFKYKANSDGNPGIEEIVHSFQPHTYVPFSALPISTAEFPVKIYAIRLGTDGTRYAAIFSVGTTYFFDSPSLYDNTVFRSYNGLGQKEKDGRRKRMKLRNLIYNVVSVALDGYDL